MNKLTTFLTNLKALLVLRRLLKVFAFVVIIFVVCLMPTVRATAEVSDAICVGPFADCALYDPVCDEDGAESVTAGDGAPDGTTFPNLDPDAMAIAIDKWVVKANPKTKFKGLGKTIVPTAKKANINPFFLVAIPRMESNMGDPNDFNVSHGNNAYGRTATAAQPHFNGARMWYKWSSVKASVDYKAPENKGARGGGDMGTYMRNVYGDSIDDGSFTDVMMKYAPPTENKTAEYVNNVKTWISELVKLTKDGGAPDASSEEDDPESSATCECPSLAADNSNGPVVVIDPGHGPSKSTIDIKTRLNMVENPGIGGDEMTHVWNVAGLVKKDLSKKGYKILMTKGSINSNVTFRERANIADKNNAALALSIHGDTGLDHPGEIYVQKVGLYRGSGGNKTTFTDAAVAQKSQDFAKIFKAEREEVSGKSVTIKDNTFNGRGGGMEGGNIPMVQLFSKTPWVYNEKKLPFKDKDYAKELVASVEKAIPFKAGDSDTSGSDATSSSAGDSCSAGGTAIAQLAMKYAWADGPHGITQKDTYAAAIRAAVAKGQYIGGGIIPGDDCGGFVTTVMRASGADRSYNNKKGDTIAQKQYMDDHPEKYEKIGKVTSTKELQAGDIAINKGHTFIYVGPQSDHPEFKGDQAAASLPNQSPRALQLGIYSGHHDGPFTFYRIKALN